jgi:hypothetical protein
VSVRTEAFREVFASELDASSLREAMGAQGYELIRGLLPVDDLNRLLDEILRIVDAAGWLTRGSDPHERIADVCAVCGPDDPQYKEIEKRLFRLESFHAFPHHPALRQVMKTLVGSRLLVHPKSALRMIFPGCERVTTPAHQDHTAVAGDPESFTAWMPLHDCPVELGPLRILEGSHRFGLQETLPGCGHVAVEKARGSAWVEGAINAGDVLIFHSMTVHAGAPNVSGQLRISMDCRFQDYARALNPATLVFAGGGKTWESIYADWRSDDLKYYWRKLPLQFKPSIAELAELARTAEPLEMRARYARILALVESA